MMSLKIERYAVSINPTLRSETPANWVELLHEIPGVEVLPYQTSAKRVMIGASDGGITGIQERFGQALRVEKLVEFRKAS
jgi:hypothetical protein